VNRQQRRFVERQLGKKTTKMKRKRAPNPAFVQALLERNIREDLARDPDTTAPAAVCDTDSGADSAAGRENVSVPVSVAVPVRSDGGGD
jgi:hypothetical protein